MHNHPAGGGDVEGIFMGSGLFWAQNYNFSRKIKEYYKLRRIWNIVMIA